MATYSFPNIPSSGLKKYDKIVFSQAAIQAASVTYTINTFAYNPSGGNSTKIPVSFTENLAKFPFNKLIGKLRIVLNGNACMVNGGSVWGTMDYMKYKKDLYLHLPPNRVIPCVSPDIRTDPTDLYSRFICAGGGGGYTGGNAYGGGWVGGTVGAAVPGTQSEGGYTPSDRTWYTLGNFGFSYSDDYSPVDNPGGGWYGGCEAWAGHDCSGGSSYASGDPNCNGTQTNSGIVLTDTGTTANCSPMSSMEWTILSLAYEQNMNYHMCTRNGTTVHKVALFYPNADVGFPTDGSFKPLMVRDPLGKECFAYLYPTKPNNYAEYNAIIDGQKWYLAEDC